MQTYPTVSSLAAASSDDVNKLWAGLGYYRRAQQLLKGAKEVLTDFNGTMPEQVPDLMKISGIGRYTAGAISSIAFAQPAPIVDGNVIRVLSRLRGVRYEMNTKPMDNVMWGLAQDLVDPSDPGNF